MLLVIWLDIILFKKNPQTRYRLLVDISRGIPGPMSGGEYHRMLTLFFANIYKNKTWMKFKWVSPPWTYPPLTYLPPDRKLVPEIPTPWKGYGTRDMWTDRHMWKHYLPATSFAGGKYFDWDSQPDLSWIWLRMNQRCLMTDILLLIFSSRMETLALEYQLIANYTAIKKYSGWNPASAKLRARKRVRYFELKMYRSHGKLLRPNNNYFKRPSPQ